MIVQQQQQQKQKGRSIYASDGLENLLSGYQRMSVHDVKNDPKSKTVTQHELLQDKQKTMLYTGKPIVCTTRAIPIPITIPVYAPAKSSAGPGASPGAKNMSTPPLAPTPCNSKVSSPVISPTATAMSSLAITLPPPAAATAAAANSANFQTFRASKPSTSGRPQRQNKRAPVWHQHYLVYTLLPVPFC